MKNVFDLSTLNWTLTGSSPYYWMLIGATRASSTKTMEIPAISASVPGSVQQALLNAGLLPDWNIGLNALQCEWVENRHWIYETVIPDGWIEKGKTHRLVCQGLDNCGWVYLNGKEVSTFTNAHLPYTFDLTPYLTDTQNRLQIIFDLPPRWLGQFGYTSRMTDWKSRFYYTWDWVSRIVQIGISDAISLEVSDGPEFGILKIQTGVDPKTGKGFLAVSGQAGDGADLQVQVELKDIRSGQLSRETFEKEGLLWENLDVDLWWPNGMGEQPLYDLVVSLVRSNGSVCDRRTYQVGFDSVEWRACEGAPPAADPWICAVNGRPIFLQGFNWTPIRPNYADLTEADYRQRLELYREMGCNVMRVWGGASLEKEVFYRLCDELGILVWQEFPLSSSGVENWPPEDERSIAELSQVAKSYLERCRHHVSLLMWGGGNELQGGLDGSKTGVGKPVDLTHPLIARFAQIVAQEDAGRRFVATSSTGPRFYVDLKDVGKGLHWDVHGPWKADPDLRDWEMYWGMVDALFHSEVGAPGASSAALIQWTAGDLPVMPADETNPLWRRTSWWIEAPLFCREKGREPASLAEYVDWSQDRQAQALVIVARSLKAKFPRCGGVIFWMGHDCFPCTANTSVIDFNGDPKPAALALAKVFGNQKK